MDFAVTMPELVRRFGVTGVSLFPRYGHLPAPHQKTAAFLGAVGLPHSDRFLSRAEGDPVNLSDRFSAEDGVLPAACGAWLEIGWFQHMTIALDPADGKVYAFPEGAPLDDYAPLNRDVESLVYTLVAFEDFCLACTEGADLDLLEARFKDRINRFDPLPFRDEDSPWSRIADDVLEASWTA